MEKYIKNLNKNYNFSKNGFNVILPKITCSDISICFVDIDGERDNYCMLDFNSWIRDTDENSERVKETKDNNISKIMQEYYNEVKGLLIDNRNKLDALVEELMKKKILFKDEIDTICNN